MLKLLSLSALASAAVLAAVAITPASANRIGGGRYSFHPGGHYHALAHRNFAPRYGLRRYAHPRNFGRWAYWHHHHHHWHWRWGSYGYAGYYGGGYAPAYGVASTPVESQAPAPVCTCLRKEYLEDGAVRFTDVCTQETAIAMSAPAPRG